MGIRYRRVNFYWLEANDTSLTEENQVKEMIVQFFEELYEELEDQRPEVIGFSFLMFMGWRDF